MKRVTHILFGTGSVVESRTTESGQSVSLIRFDSSTVDRLILASSLKPSSSAPVDSGEAPKKRGGKKADVPLVKKTGHRRAKPTSEEIADTLLVEDLDESLPPRSESLLEEYEEA